jgi:prepilin peptidase CpaA
MAIAQLIILWLCMGFLTVIAWRDFLTYRISNRNVLILTAMVAVLVFLRGVQGEIAYLVPDLFAGGLLFVLGFVMWILGAMGAGDVKLYFPLGVLVGWSLLPIYVVFLLIASIVMLVAIWLGRRFPRENGGLRARLTEIARARKVPYGVPMVAGAILTLLPQAMTL